MMSCDRQEAAAVPDFQLEIHTDQTRCFLARRLRYCSLALAIVTTCVLGAHVATGIDSAAYPAICGIAAACLWAITLQLHRPSKQADISRLRRVEVGLFFCTFTGYSVLLYSHLQSTVDGGGALYLVTAREYLFVTVTLILLYGLFIPNRSLRTATVSLCLSLIPLMTFAVNLRVNSSELQFPTGTSLTLFSVESLLILAIGIGCSAWGTGFNNRVQEQLFKAEELGPYVLKKKLGSGGMGHVYMAEHRLLKRMCAVKLIHPDKAEDREMLDRFEREVKSTARLTHPNTVRVFDYGHTRGGRFYYSMELLEGLNLWQFVEKFGPMPPERVIYVLKQICGALHESGSEGLVHRDIKPSNIFLAERGHTYDVAKLLDFGLVRPALKEAVGMKRVSTRIHGSPDFMSPEQAEGIEPDVRGDLYSLGAVGYYLLTGHPPFRDRNPIMLIVAHATTPVPDFAEIGVDVPQDLARVILTCLEKKPEDRYRSAREVLIALEGCEHADRWTWCDAEDWWQRHVPDATRASGKSMSDDQPVDSHRVTQTGSTHNTTVDPAHSQVMPCGPLTTMVVEHAEVYSRTDI
jgi:serine/threonine-protein kinase